MSRKLFISDTHFNHKMFIVYENLSFENIKIMNEFIVYNWNNKVRDNDYIYVIGDFSLGSKLECENILKQLKGNIILIIGSHDRVSLKCKEYFKSIHDRLYIKIASHPTVLDHYCGRSWHRSHYNSWLLHGHYHGSRKPIGKAHDCGAICNNFTPLLDEEIVEIMKHRKDNPDYILREKENERKIISG